MKKTAYFFAIAAIATTIFGCTSNNDSDTSIAKQDTVPAIISAAEADTLARSLGLIQGSDVNYEKQEIMSTDSIMTIYADSAYIRGFEAAIGADITDPGYSQGVRAAREIIFKIEEFKSYGVEIDRDLLLAAIERQFTADTITSTQMQSLNSIYNQLLKKVYSQQNQ